MRKTPLLLFLLPFLFISSFLRAQEIVDVRDSVNSRMFHHAEIYSYEDPKGLLTFKQITSDSLSGKFKPSLVSTPQSRNSNSTFWYRVRINYPATAKKKYLLEFFDQSIDQITAYVPNKEGHYVVKNFGDDLQFDHRTYDHKNFEIEIYPAKRQVSTYYFKIKSVQRADIIIVLRSVDFFIHYALREYFYFGIFYGMILVFSFYNLLMFLAVRQRQYLDFIVYILAVGCYQMSIDGVGFQFLWPGYPGLNDYSVGISLYVLSISSLVFTRDLLYLKRQSPILYKAINYLVIARSLWLVVCFIYPRFFSYRLLELLPLSLSFYAGIYIFYKGFQPAKFFALGYTALFVGFLFKLIIEITGGKFNINVISYYSLSFCFIIEMIFLSFAISERVRLLQIEKLGVEHQLELDHSEKEIVRLKNEKLEAEVNFKNRELSNVTMHLVQRGKVLSKIKDDISAFIKKHEIPQSSLTFKQLIKLIKEVEKEDEDWEQFAMHFNQMNTGLFEILKSRFPDLTSNELKLCAYIKSNLSTKEIAQLMNITSKAVEIGRYRLRKKLQLQPEVNLFEFLMTIKADQKV
ncbi:chromosome partitioning protein ParA [Pedobacter sp. HMF7647]|uniref:Chromosome partitioning protein ParA n=1 Tax=Hufsiella arboris TaxID=2695275 RepID=A0A7K1Y6E6_9SPHI|nr:7TM diverse intracellular signaling domain-containing protein [Hufsiella arboris]MXV50147.1 chromosome partitioning protein ParA [Hufsiella arboris]